MRDLGAPGFREANDAAQLTAIFAATRNLPLGDSVLHTPVFTEPPQSDANGMLRLVGRIPMRPMAVLFEMHFEDGPGGRRLFGLSIAGEQFRDPPRKDGQP